LAGPAPGDLSLALSEGFQEATAEKVWRLIGVLRELQAYSSTKNRFVLKGGTALNVFHLPAIPRLSVDLDLMATGFKDAAPDTVARTELIGEILTILEKMGYDVQSSPSNAACTVYLSYRNALGSPDQIKLDLDLLNRMTLLPPEVGVGPPLFLAEDLEFPLAAQAELFGQKLTAVAYRAAPRDLFDMFLMLREGWHLKDRARGMYLAYSFLNDAEMVRLAYPTRLDVDYRPNDLLDVLRDRDAAPALEEIRASATSALSKSEPSFTQLTEHELELRKGLIRGDRNAFAALAGETSTGMQRALADHPGLSWRLMQSRGGRRFGDRSRHSGPQSRPRLDAGDS
jgi:predicted nucleotidyltransferase component of viral defense system